MKNVMLAGVLTAMMLTSAATAAVPCAQGINNANNADSAGSVITVTSSAKASRKSTAVKLSRLSDCTVIYPEYAKVCGEPYVAELTKDRTIQGKLELYDGETLYVPSGYTLTLNSSSALYGGTLFVENGANLIIKDRMTIYDNASLICDGRINVGRQGSICMYNGGILYTSPESTIKLNADSHLYSTDYASIACLGEMITPYILPGYNKRS